MKDREKQIEEMAKVMCRSFNSCENCMALSKDLFGKANLTDCECYNYAIELYAHGYRKIPKDSVVIPEKITEETSPNDIIKIAKYNEKVRKETAVEVLNLLLDEPYSIYIDAEIVYEIAQDVYKLKVENGRIRREK